MCGRPVWLASISLRDSRSGLVVPTEKWSPVLRQEAKRKLYVALAGVGEMENERGFRMCSTMCIHRALSDAEIAGLPNTWDDTPPATLAGGPLEVLWERGIQSPLSTRPCENPTMEPLGQPGLYFPLDCEECPTCLARIEFRERALREWRDRHPEHVRPAR